MTSTDPQPRRGSNFLSGLLGGFVVLAVGGGLIATGVLGDDEGDNPKQSATAQSATRPVDDGGSDSARSVSDIYKDEGQGVVFVRSEGVSSGGSGDSPFGQPDSQRGTATGSGFVVDKDGYVVTNAHVVEGAKKVSVSFDEKTSSFVDAEVKGTDVSSDLAVLKIDPSDVKDIKVLPLGNSSDAKVGAPTIAIGNPFGFTRTVTTGIVSAVQRTIEAPEQLQHRRRDPDRRGHQPGQLRRPAAGRPGRVIGINAQIATGGQSSGGSIGIGFAIPVNTAQEAAPRPGAGPVDQARLPRRDHRAGEQRGGRPAEAARQVRRAGPGRDQGRPRRQGGPARRRATPPPTA